jgi:hypothetical protein
MAFFRRSQVSQLAQQETASISLGVERTWTPVSASSIKCVINSEPSWCYEKIAYIEQLAKK